jgi:hypothetical protein
LFLTELLFEGLRKYFKPGNSITTHVFFNERDPENFSKPVPPLAVKD